MSVYRVWGVKDITAFASRATQGIAKTRQWLLKSAPTADILAGKRRVMNFGQFVMLFINFRQNVNDNG
ncbi:MAG: hypothetical protein C7B43_20090 [Sulfobacillus benefaciens]|uniref:Uncharacterized protein n=1 Tax=Sulfobacillus benefaciens TaxID=453960 RepID=A0A2T2WMG3_9FIRM|nr:MAG: hypothetical protein C7B43_20090 [Sulfobacillus benefaciens]HBQ94746.1 hypothetical protein [Sulfobacillus sp.]